MNLRRSGLAIVGVSPVLDKPEIPAAVSAHGIAGHRFTHSQVAAWPQLTHGVRNFSQQLHSFLACLWLPPNNSLNPTPLRVHGEITRSRRRGLAQALGFIMKVDRVRLPDEIKYGLNSIGERLDEIASLAENGLNLSGLRVDEQTALDFFNAIHPIDDIIDNINLVVSDLGVLAKSSRAFKDAHPMRRYKLLVRTFFYEFSRFEDTHSLFTSWLQSSGYISKIERKAMRQGFYEAIEPLVKLRNTLSHGIPDWSGSYSHEIGLLEGLDLAQMTITDKEGKKLAWDDHLAPLCSEMASAFHEYTANIRTYWNMLASDIVLILIDRGLLKKATKPYVGKVLFKNRVRQDEA